MCIRDRLVRDHQVMHIENWISISNSNKKINRKRCSINKSLWLKGQKSKVKLIRAHGGCPVSYTHLDVYKRQGQFYDKVVPTVIEKLGNLLLAQEEISHSYPFDWRTKKPIIWRAEMCIRDRFLTKANVSLERLLLIWVVAKQVLLLSVIKNYNTQMLSLIHIFKGN